MLTATHPQKIVLVARQAGTANAFLPLIDFLAKRKRKTELFAYPSAARQWRNAGLSGFTEISGFDEAGEKKLRQADYLITGTCPLSVEGDVSWWQAARAINVPSIAFIDQWVNMAARFHQPENADPVLPDKISVIDEGGIRLCEEEGMPPAARARLVVAGTPAFDALKPHKEAALALRKAHGIGEDTRLCLCIDEPLSFRWPEDVQRRQFGYTESEVWQGVMHSLRQLVETPLKIAVAVRAHPLANTVISDDHGLNIIPAAGDRLLWVQAADALIGMHSMLLLEGAMLGTPVISYQPRRRKPCYLTDNRKNITVVTEPAKLRQALQAALKRQKAGADNTDEEYHSRFFCQQLGII